MATVPINLGDSQVFQQDVLSNLQRIDREFSPQPSVAYSMPAYKRPPSLLELQSELSKLEQLPFFLKKSKQARIAHLRQETNQMLFSIQRLKGDLQNLINLDSKNTRVAQLEKMIADSGSLNVDNLSFLEREIVRCRDEFYITNAEITIKRKNIKKHLCAALEKASSDMYETAKIITPLLIGLVSSGVLQMNLTPLWIAAIAFAISRMGVASLCTENADKK